MDEFRLIEKMLRASVKLYIQIAIKKLIYQMCSSPTTLIRFLLNLICISRMLIALLVVWVQLAA
ncbi:MAG: hypothetical protein DLM72_09445 [Candidatus Nitrosopolaris wilkensis]|nr:MAG: hypothetical protein DLM72_09445 [Candidatus Nitrosopolaris wilkensis]